MLQSDFHLQISDDQGGAADGDSVPDRRGQLVAGCSHGDVTPLGTQNLVQIC